MTGGRRTRNYHLEAVTHSLPSWQIIQSSLGHFKHLKCTSGNTWWRPDYTDCSALAISTRNKVDLSPNQSFRNYNSISQKRVTMIPSKRKSNFLIYHCQISKANCSKICFLFLVCTKMNLMALFLMEPEADNFLITLSPKKLQCFLQFSTSRRKLWYQTRCEINSFSLFKNEYVDASMKESPRLKSFCLHD